MKKFLLAAVATLMLATSVFATGLRVSIGRPVANVAVVHNVGFHNQFAVRAFSFAQPVYQSSFAYFNAPSFALVAQPPVAAFTAPVDPCQPVQEVPAQLTYAAPAPTVTYTAPVFTSQLFSVAPGYTVSSYGAGFGVRRFAVVNTFGVRRLARVDRILRAPRVVQIDVFRHGLFGHAIHRTRRR